MLKLFAVVFSIVCIAQFSFAKPKDDSFKDLSCAFIKPTCQNIKPISVYGPSLNIHYTTTKDLVYLHAQVVDSPTNSKISKLILSLQALNNTQVPVVTKNIDLQDGVMTQLESDDLTVPGSGQTYKVRCLASNKLLLPNVCSAP